MSLQKVAAAVAANRSLWVELECPTFAYASPPGITLVTDPMHCTLLFLGKGASPEYLEKVCLAVRRLSFEPFESRLSGLARFRGSEKEGDPIVLLLSDPRIREMNSRLIKELHFTGGDWDYTPHISLGRVGKYHNLMTHPHPANNRVRFTGIAVCAGEDRWSPFTEELP